MTQFFMSDFSDSDPLRRNGTDCAASGRLSGNLNLQRPASQSNKSQLASGNSCTCQLFPFRGGFSSITRTITRTSSSYGPVLEGRELGWSGCAAVNHLNKASGQSYVASKSGSDCSAGLGHNLCCSCFLS